MAHPLNWRQNGWGDALVYASGMAAPQPIIEVTWAGDAQGALPTTLEVRLNWNGGGYEGLEGEGIPLSGRIVTVADVFDALTQKRPYKPAWPVADALAEIQRQRGRQFDPRLVDAFMRVIQRMPA